MFHHMKSSHAGNALPTLISQPSAPNLRCRINLLASVRNPLRRGVVQVHETPAACASADIPPWEGSVGSVVDGSVSRDTPGATR